MSPKRWDKISNRRSFLKAMGLAGAGAMGLGLGLPVIGGAQRMGAPKRVVFMINTQGWVWRDRTRPDAPNTFRMFPAGAPASLGQYAAHTHPPRVPGQVDFDHMPDDDEYELDLVSTPLAQYSQALAPLYRHRQRLVAIDGLGMLSAAVDAYGDAHAAGYCHALTGAPARLEFDGVKSMASQPSINYRIAEHLRRENPSLTDLVAVDYAVTDSYVSGVGNPFHAFLYRDAGEGLPIRVPMERSVSEALLRLFPGSAPPDDRVLQAAQPQVLALLASEYQRLAPQLSPDDRTRLELHHGMLTDLNRRLSTLSSLACDAPVLGAAPPEGSLDALNYNNDGFMDLIAMSFACDITRVATVTHGSLYGGEDPRYWGGDAGDYHHSYAHPASPDWAWRTGAEYDDHYRAVRVQTNRMIWHANRVAGLADRLAAIPEGEGTVLDNTAIVWINEISHGGHGHDQWPVVIVGGLGGAFRTGRYLRYPQNNPSPWMRNYGRQFAGHPHTQLLTSICQTMGMDVSDMGLSSIEGHVRVGPYAGTRRAISLRGPLERLMA